MKPPLTRTEVIRPEDIRRAMQRLWDQPYRVEAWPHHPKCIAPLAGNHVICPIRPQP